MTSLPWSQGVTQQHEDKIRQLALQVTDLRLHQLQTFYCGLPSRHILRVATKVQQICINDICWNVFFKR
jgi:hypothetical protein